MSIDGREKSLHSRCYATAKFNGKAIAETDSFEFVEGNIYFPPNSELVGMMVVYLREQYAIYMIGGVLDVKQGK